MRRDKKKGTCTQARKDCANRILAMQHWMFDTVLKIVIWGDKTDKIIESYTNLQYIKHMR